ncbi:MAG: rRNA maturation RNase YbeY [Bacilli bacterium]|nr:rRNA maturation RNase YbeY [Bacilli bacterium]MDY6430687.1 rRNA maturation RNase YbeY [Bacilli bacterium]
MELVFNNELDEIYDFYEEKFLKLLEITFNHLSIKTNYEVDVNLVDREKIHEINREYRKIDRETDVISFAFLDDKSDIGHINSKDIPVLLGEIFICLDVAQEQAKNIGNSLNREVCFLFIHGLLHLLGYDHMKEDDEKVMFPLQEEILNIYLKGEENGF